MKIDFLTPTQANRYNVFCNEYEENATIVFHATPVENLESILKNGFQSAEKLKKGPLSSIAFAKNSYLCLQYMGKPIRQDFCIFAVQFDLTHPNLNTQDIYIYINDTSVQPKILGYCLVNKGFDYI